MLRRSRALVLSLLVALLVPLAGCAEKLTERNFSLASNAVGFDKGGTASFTLTYDPRALSEETRFDIEPKYAVERVKFDRVGSFFQEVEVNDARELNLRVLVNGTEVSSYTFTAQNRSVELRLDVPKDLATDRYVLRLTLLQVGEVASNEFRVTDP
ncbi:MAG TPA: hypothetical protein VNZ52_09560 [Candidatus Thermoplasmatota archaeon]|nr:hypothetical protein [Candidatus Thermoplasmatota archaeon]